MDTLPLHPRLVHLPMALAALMPLLAFALTLAWWRGWLPRRTWWVVVGLQLALAGGAFASLRSGEREEDRAQKVVAERLIEAHEEAADAFTVGAVLVLVLALGAALWPREGAAKLVAVAASLGTLAVLALGVRTGTAGGELVYKYNAGAAWSQPPGAGSPAGPGTVGEPKAPAAEEHGSKRGHGEDKD